MQAACCVRSNESHREKGLNFFFSFYSPIRVFNACKITELKALLTRIKLGHSSVMPKSEHSRNFGQRIPDIHSNRTTWKRRDIIKILS